MKTEKSMIHQAMMRIVRPTVPSNLGWSGGAMVLGKLPVPGRPACLD